MATSNALGETNRAVSLQDGYETWKRDVQTYHE